MKKRKLYSLVIAAVIAAMLLSCMSAFADDAGGDAEAFDPIFGNALTLEEAMHALPVPAAAHEYVEKPLSEPREERLDPITPIQMFDNVYYVGTTGAGALVIPTSEGIVLLGTGYGLEDTEMMAEQMKSFGLDPADIRLIILEHEHGDHYGGINIFLDNYCPDALVAMSLLAWNMLQVTADIDGYPEVGAAGFIDRPKKCDIFLTDGMALKIGDFKIACFYTPGHSVGTTSYIFPVTWKGEPHMAAMFGGTAASPDQVSVEMYYMGIEYFKAFTDAAGCDVGLTTHTDLPVIQSVLDMKEGDPNPLIIGQERFDTEFLQYRRDLVNWQLESGSYVAKPQGTPPPDILKMLIEMGIWHGAIPEGFEQYVPEDNGESAEDASDENQTP